jgi:pimeloyl-ACP methyl ester carboxylesterase
MHRFAHKLWYVVLLIVIGVAQAQPPAQQTLNISGMLVDIVQPTAPYRGDMLVLPGWNFSRTDWCDKSALCTQARAAGYRLILPEMGKSIYATRTYPETRADWRTLATLTFVVDTLLPALQAQHKVLLPGGNNYLVGLSTGGRGVAMIALRTGKLFKAGAALSGDFDQTLQPTDNLMRGWYGPQPQFPDRWTGEDNPARNAARLQVPLYLGHGEKDNIVPVAHTLTLHRALQQHNPLLRTHLHLDPAAGHDYTYWNSEVQNVLKFFAATQ